MNSNTDKNGRKGSEDGRLERVEQLLRSQPPLELSADFKRNVMEAVRHTPPADLVSAHQGWLSVVRQLGIVEKAAAVFIVLAFAALLVPGTTELLTVWGYELSAAQFSFSYGESIVSVSALTLSLLGIAAAFLTGIGAYSARNGLISA